MAPERKATGHIIARKYLLHTAVFCCPDPAASYLRFCRVQDRRNEIAFARGNSRWMAEGWYTLGSRFIPFDDGLNTPCWNVGIVNGRRKTDNRFYRPHNAKYARKWRWERTPKPFGRMVRPPLLDPFISRHSLVKVSASISQVAHMILQKMRNVVSTRVFLEPDRQLPVLVLQWWWLPVAVWGFSSSRYDIPKQDFGEDKKDLYEDWHFKYIKCFKTTVFVH